MNISRAAEPSKLLFVGDYGWFNQWYHQKIPVAEWHDLPAYYNMAFLDGHVKFLRIAKGIYIAPTYRVNPFEDLDPLVYSLQREFP